MKSCKNCAHSIFDDRWGEWKCKKKCITCPAEAARTCKFYEKRKEEKK